MSGSSTLGERPETSAVALVSPDDIRAARERLRDVIRPTPTWASQHLSRLVSRPVLLKPEQLQRTGSFKIRGAYNFLHSLPPGGEVVAGSAGNHAQGVALAATLTGRPATIYMPANAPLPKVQATRGYGARVILEDEAVDSCLSRAKKHARERGAVFVPPFDDPHVLAGQGTIGLEIAEEAPQAATVVVPVGGGGLVSGIAAALAAVRPDVRVVGVEPEGAASMRASVEAGRVVAIDRAATMADGVALKRPCELTLAHVRAYVADVVTVSEEEISQAVLVLLERCKALVEPAGALSLAALLAGKVGGTGPAVAVLSGGNVDSLLLLKLIDHGLSAAGRYVVLRVVLQDRPGTLAALTAVLGQMGLNVLSVEHHRAGVGLPLDAVEIVLTLETRDPEHRAEIAAALQAEGYPVELVR